MIFWRKKERNLWKHLANWYTGRLFKRLLQESKFKKCVTAVPMATSIEQLTDSPHSTSRMWSPRTWSECIMMQNNFVSTKWVWMWPIIGCKTLCPIYVLYFVEWWDDPGAGTVSFGYKSTDDLWDLGNICLIVQTEQRWRQPAYRQHPSPNKLAGSQFQPTMFKILSFLIPYLLFSIHHLQTLFFFIHAYQFAHPFSKGSQFFTTLIDVSFASA